MIPLNRSQGLRFGVLARAFPCTVDGVYFCIGLESSRCIRCTRWTALNVPCACAPSARGFTAPQLEASPHPGLGG